MNDKQLQILLEWNLLPVSERREIQRLILEGFSLEALVETLSVWSQRDFPISENSKEELRRCREENIEIIHPWHFNYPKLLKYISDFPIILYGKGNLNLLNDDAIAVVGSRYSTLYGEMQTSRFCENFAEEGMVIISGLAKGIDSSAHRSALKLKGKTIGILGCGVNRVYPLENEKLYEQVLENNGLILSEFPLDAKPLAYHFPRRNRILSGLSLGTLVVEAHERSGSLITAYQALEQGREVFAIPGGVDQLTSKGTHRLIREGALLVEHPKEVLDILQNSSMKIELQKPSAVENQIYFEERNEKKENAHPILSYLRKEKEVFLHELMSSVDMDPQDFLTMISQFEFEGYLKRLRGGKVKILR